MTATTESPSPSANSVSVAEGTRLAIRIPQLSHGPPPQPGGDGFAAVGSADKLRAVERLDDDQIDARLGELEGWERDGEAIVKTFKLADFVGSVGFVDKLVEPAEDMGHHPDLSVSWNEVRVSITTHAAGGLTENDFELAKRIDALA